MKQLFIIVFTITMVYSGQAQEIHVSTGQLVRHVDFPSEFVDSRNIDVWLPADYSKDKKYAVLYMHDGQMLFDPSITWNQQAWGIDEVVGRLINEKRIKDCIVVGIWNTPLRFAEYFPQKAWHYISAEEKYRLLDSDVYVTESMIEEKPLADNYLKFMVQELKPFIDSTYSVLTNKENIFIMGSSMGGLISLYAICEYPGIFGGAGCMSTHWPAMGGKAIEYFKNNLPNPEDHRIYFDFGTGTLDADYEPYQKKMDQIMEQNGYVRGKNFISLKFEGASHCENDWKKRLDKPLTFLLHK